MATVYWVQWNGINQDVNGDSSFVLLFELAPRRTELQHVRTLIDLRSFQLGSPSKAIPVVTITLTLSVTVETVLSQLSDRH